MTKQQEYKNNRCNNNNEGDSKVAETSHETPQANLEGAVFKGERLNPSKPNTFDNDDIHADNNEIFVDSMERTNQYEGSRDDSMPFHQENSHLENLHSYQYRDGSVHPYTNLADDNLYQTSNIMGNTIQGYNDGESSFTK